MFDEEDMVEIDLKSPAILPGGKEHMYLASRQPHDIKDMRYNTIAQIRQLFCPACYERLAPESLRHEQNSVNCWQLFFPLQRCLMKGHARRQVICTKCGCDLGYWKAL